jgi:hypothetical protein
MTVLEVLTAATGYLEKREVENPRLNAEKNDWIFIWNLTVRSPMRNAPLCGI